ncbi:MAG: PQQ-binding-like beta-propeller repeat protein [Pirellula sp.]
MSSSVAFSPDPSQNIPAKPNRRKGLWLLGLVPIAALVAAIASPMLRGPGPRARHTGAGTRPEATLGAIADPVANRANTVAEPSVELPAWSRFRGPNGSGISLDESVPTQWSESENLKWSTSLPGPGSSSPILTDKLVFVTCYSGIETEGRQADTSRLQRHVVCLSRQDGQILWQHTEQAVQPEDRYQGMGVPEHGYATNTPVTDGKRLYAFLGKSGVLALDLEGNKLWQTSVGTESGNRGWGTAASLILFEDLVIVNASEESQTIRALRSSDGQEVWKATGSALELAYGTPILAKVDEQRTDLVIAVPGEIWGLNPRTGKLVWYAETSLTGNLSPSLLLDGQTVIAFGGYRSSGSVAVRVGGNGDVSKTHTVWTSRNSSYVSTPVLLDEKLYWIDDKGTYYVSSAKTGELIQRSRVSNITSRDRPVYASAIALGKNLLFQTRFDGLLVASATPELNVVRQNRFESDKSMCNATPAVDHGELYIRSDSKIYCVGSKQ